MVPPYYSQLGAWRKDNTEGRYYKLALLYASDGEFGENAPEFLDHQVAELWHCTPMEARNAPAEDYFNALEYHAAKNQGLSDRMKSQQQR